MSKSLKDLRTEFQSKYDEAQGLLKQETLSAEDVQKVESLNGECETLRGQIEAVKKVDDLRTRQTALGSWATAVPGSPALPAPLGPTNPTGAPANAGTYGNGVNVLGVVPAGTTILENKVGGFELANLDAEGKLDKSYRGGAFKAAHTEEYATAYRRMLLSGFNNLTHGEQATLQEGIDSQGGYLAPQEVLNRVLQREPTPTRLAGRVTQINTSRDGVWMPKVNYSTDDLYTTGIRATWTGEQPASASAHRVTEPVFGAVHIPVFTAMLSILVTNDLMEDSMFDLMGWLGGKFSETIELLKDNMILNGTGVSQPMGILASPGSTNHPAVINSGAAAALTGDGLINLTEALPEQYDENAVLVFNKTNTGKAIRLLKDGDGRPLVNYGSADNGLASGRYKEVNGYPYIWSGFAPNVAANAHPIVFGDLRGYFQVNRVGLSIQILNEVYAEVNGKLLLGRVRFGGLTAEEWRLRAQKVAA
jgi:HK97 family phage major capsid protein